MAPRVWVFFYGSYMNLDVLGEVDLAPEPIQVARLAGFDIRIAPRANLVPSPLHVAYGLLTTATHAELDRLYTHARDALGEVYLPHAVLVETQDGTHRPALVYLCADMAPRPADAAYVERILSAARRLGFPAGYIERLQAAGA